MKESERRERVRRRTAEVLDRLERREADRLGEPPQPGDLYVFRETAESSVQWAVLEAGDERLLVVAADLGREVGSADVAVERGGVGAALTLRCRFAVWMPAAAFDPCLLTGRLTADALDRARRKRESIELGIVRASYTEDENDSDSHYQDLLEDLAGAREALVTGVEGAVAAPQLSSAIRLPGIDATSGDSLVSTLMLAQACEHIRAEVADRFLEQWLKRAHQLRGRPALSLAPALDATDLAQAGWAVVFHADEPVEVRRAMEPLIEHRRRGGGAVKVLGVRHGDDWREWLARHGVAAGEPVTPERIPYYLLLVGPPTRIPYEFQSALAVEYALGRLCFADPVDYRCYVESLIAAETGAVPPPERRAVFFNPCHPGDAMSRTTAELLAEPLARELESGRDFEAVRLLGASATRARLAAALAGDEEQGGAALLFAAAHGVGWPAGHPEQAASQGALLCQGWPGSGPVEPDTVFAARDVTESLSLRGAVAFLYVSFGAGTPRRDELLRDRDEAPRLADEPFVARLPQRLLANPGGSALAVIGLVDRAWGFALAPASAEERRRPFREVLEALIEGEPAGHATRELNRLYAARASELARLLKKMDYGARVDERELATLWVERNFVRSFLVLGDPAARLRTL